MRTSRPHAEPAGHHGPAARAGELLAAIPSLPEGRLGAALAGRLPGSTPPAPWQVRGAAVLWWHRATAAAVHALPEPLRCRARLPVTLACLVRYDDTPVGPYAELWVSPVVLLTPLPRVHVPFIAVDSVASVQAGRAHWALPKVLADLSWGPGGWAEGPTLAGPVTVRGEGFGLDVRVDRPGPSLPFRVRFGTRQLRPDGSLADTPLRLSGRGAPARVHVQVQRHGGGYPSLPDLLRPGGHRAVVVTGARMRVGQPRRAQYPAPYPPPPEE